MLPAAPAPAAPPRGSRWLLAALAVVWFAAEVAFLRALPLADLVAAIPDDSFFYLRLAEEFWRSGEFSFDGVHPTYGFQPLWQLLLIAVAPLAADSAALLQLALALCAALHVATGIALGRLGARLGGAWAGLVAGAAWLANPALMVWCWGLKENGLFALCWVLALQALLGQLQAGASRRGGAWLGLWLGLAVFARVNAAAVAGLALAALVLARGAGGGWRARASSAAVAAAVLLLVAAPWYAYAHLHFGSAMPTSGTWKMLIGRGEWELGRQLPWFGAAHLQHALAATPAHLRFLFGHGFGAAAAPLLLLAAGGVLAAAGAWRRAPAAAAVALVATAAALVSSYANVLCLEKYLGYADWYAVTEYTAVPLLAGAGAGAVARWRRPWWRCAALAGLVAAAWWLPLGPGLQQRLRPDRLAEPPRQLQLLELGLWLRRQLPAELPVGMWDPGILAFFRGGRSTSCDPLMNSLDYQQRFVADPFGFPGRYAREQGLAWMVGGSIAEDPTRLAALPAAPGATEPPGEVVWLPYPDFDLGWSERRWLLLVRPAGVAAPPLDEAAFGFGVLYPNDPARRRVVVRDRDRLLAGVECAAAALRLQLALPAAATAELRVDGAVVERFAAAQNGWICRDAAAWAGRRVQVLLHGAGPDALPQAQLVDLRWP